MQATLRRAVTSHDDEDIQLTTKNGDMNMDDIQDLMLKHLEEEGTTSVNRDEFETMLNAAGTDIADEELTQIFAIFDSNSDGELSHRDIVQFICKKKKMKKRKKKKTKTILFT